MEFDLSKESDEKLIELLHTKTPTGPLYIAAKIEYDKRVRKRDFWRKDIVAWLALCVSIISLSISIFSMYMTQNR